MKSSAKFISLLLALLMAFSLMSTAAFAEEPEDGVKDALSGLAEKFLQDPEGCIDKADKAFALVDIGEDVLSVMYHIDRMKDTAEDARFELEALKKKIRFALGNIGKPDDPIGEAQVEIDNFVDRERHEGEQINEDIDNINKLGGLLGKLTGKDIPQIPAFEYEPVDFQLQDAIDGILGGIFG